MRMLFAPVGWSTMRVPEFKNRRVTIKKSAINQSPTFYRPISISERSFPIIVIAVRRKSGGGRRRETCKNVLSIDAARVFPFALSRLSSRVFFSDGRKISRPLSTISSDECPSDTLVLHDLCYKNWVKVRPYHLSNRSDCSAVKLPSKARSKVERRRLAWFKHATPQTRSEGGIASDCTTALSQVRI